MDLILSIFRIIGILFLVIMMFNLMIIVHEWGHFLAGRWRGLYIDRFQIWFGKPIWSKTINGVQYGLGSIPAGGFVSLPQMAPMESIEGKVEGAEDLPPVKPLDKIIVAFAGPLFSFLLACAFAVIVWGVGRPVSESQQNAVVGFIQEGSNAEKSGLEKGDRILAVNGEQIVRFSGMNESLQWAIIAAETDQLTLDVEKLDGQKTQVIVERPAVEKIEHEGPWFQKLWHTLTKRPPLPAVGLGPASTPLVSDVLESSPAALAGMKKGDIITAIEGVPIRYSFQIVDREWEKDTPVSFTIDRRGKPVDLVVTPRVPEVLNGAKAQPRLGAVFNREGVREVVRQTPVYQVKAGLTSMANMLRALVSPNTSIKAGHMSGPVGIMGVFYDLFQMPSGWKLVLWFAVILNINLAILNLLPFPVLDGGHIVMAILEAIRNRPIHPRLLEGVQTAFVLVLFSFMGYVTLKDVGDRVGRLGGEEQKSFEFRPINQTQ